MPPRIDATFLETHWNRPVAAMAGSLSGGRSRFAPVRFALRQVPRGHKVTEFVLKRAAFAAPPFVPHLVQDFIRGRLHIAAHARGSREIIPPLLSTSDETAGSENPAHYIARVDLDCFYVEEFEAGGTMIPREAVTESQLHTLGAQLAELHDHPDGVGPFYTALPSIAIGNTLRRIGMSPGFVDVAREIETRGATTAPERFLLQNRRILEDELAYLRDGRVPERFDALPKRIITGDAALHNMLWDTQGERIARMIDWGNSNYQVRVDEFRNAILAAGPGRGRIYRRKVMVLVLQGYQAEAHKRGQPLSAEEISIVPDLLAATYMWDFWDHLILNPEDDWNEDFVPDVATMLRIFRGERIIVSKHQLMGLLLNDLLAIRVQFPFVTGDDLSASPERQALVAEVNAV
jgi:hypothetical protein